MQESVARSESQMAREGDRMKVKSCARCDKQLPTDPAGRVYSHYTRLYFCADFDACSKRTRRRKRAEVKV